MTKIRPHDVNWN